MSDVSTEGVQTDDQSTATALTGDPQNTDQGTGGDPGAGDQDTGAEGGSADAAADGAGDLHWGRKCCVAAGGW